MSQPHRPVNEKTNDIPNEIAELAAAIAELPSEHRQKLQSTMDRVVESATRRRRILGLVQDALSQLRMDMKYLMFDLEATRRERDDFRRQVEDAQRE